MRKKTFGLVFLAGLYLLGGAAHSADDVMLRQYGLDHPHGVPGDYVYRTPRVFMAEKPGERFSWPWLTGGSREVMPAETGIQLRLRVRELAAQLLAGSKEPVAGELRVTVATFVNLDQIYETSALGRYLAEQMLHELQRRRVDVFDIRMMPAMQISQGHGEYALSRDMNELSYVHQADAVVAGTYSVADGQIFVQVRLLENGTGLLLASSSLAFKMDGLVEAMLKDSGQPLPTPIQQVAIEDFPGDGEAQK
ncbi:MAG: FlgO family outer membrane protein [Desulfurivibrionaceae bacterium]|nr:FlgO family outer membrane protein [Desulfurivibrionaceae bacterium]